MNATLAVDPTASALLDPAASALQARPLRSWPASQKEHVRWRMVALHQDWVAEWLPLRDAGAREPEVQVIEAAGESDAAASWAFASASRRASGSGAPHDAALLAIGAAMFGTEAAPAVAGGAHPGRIADRIALAAWNDWLHRIDTALNGFALAPRSAAAGASAETPSHAWSGALQLRWPWCGGLWTLDLPHEAVAALLGSAQTIPPEPADRPASSPKERLDRALSDQPVTLRVLLEGAELNLGQLQGLRLDDVVPLAHRLDTPAIVVGTDGQQVCDGWLGQSEGRIAIELTRLATSPTVTVSPAGASPRPLPSKEEKS
ncbi:Type III flagellar switch regulator (C-ring) FliN C-term [Variovorax sp. PDC80]|uniref:FliM/FliN family flagellar motor switch protein n=1 Tax=Variovorax sp. PDC80 TaxID=1882827 RepID=UPI0008DF9FDB|nr:FliM/FliN family flagellar motor C-terminal domain-containing protein [Variovorax sp. PDC80]SFO54174.1 Type III flagellar switch regulator (C-ring) FliN C-term [Variovorax sp. PDC80]